MNSPDSTITYRCSQGVRWSVATRGIVLVNAAGGTAFLEYPQAAAWDFVSRGFSFEQTVPLLCAIESLDAEQAGRFLAASLEEWVEAGFLLRKADRG